jgi:hypothetical protein
MFVLIFEFDRFLYYVCVYKIEIFCIFWYKLVRYIRIHSKNLSLLILNLNNKFSFGIGFKFKIVVFTNESYLFIENINV